MASGIEEKVNSIDPAWCIRLISRMIGCSAIIQEINGTLAECVNWREYIIYIRMVEAVCAW